MKRKIITIMLLLLSLFVLALGFAACGNGYNEQGAISNSEVKSVKDIEIGYTHAQVRDILGEPYVKSGEEVSDTVWEYYDDSYVGICSSIIQKNDDMKKAVMEGDADKASRLTEDIIKLEQQLFTLTYKYMKITFSAEEEGDDTIYKVYAVLYDSVCNASVKIDKKTESIILSKVPAFSDMSFVKVSAKISFTDGSYKNMYVSDNSFAELDTFKADSKNVTWSDDWGTYTATLTVDMNIPKGTEIKGKFGGHGTFTATAVSDGTSNHLPDFSAVIGSIGSDYSVIGGDADYSDYSVWNKIKNYVKDVVVSDGIKVIGKECFAGDKNIESITLPKDLKTIETDAFKGCISLSGITVESGNSVYHSDGNCLIATKSKTVILGCKSSKIPSDGSVTDIGESAFIGCSGLTSIEVPNSVTNINCGTFSGCSGLISITLPFVGKSKEAGGSFGYIFGTEEYPGCLMLAQTYGLKYCIPKSLRNVTITGGDIHKESFKYCIGLTSVTLPNSVTSIPNRAFVYCSSLKSIKIPNSATTIEQDAFSSCHALTSIEIPNSVMSIGDGAFNDCRSLTSIKIPNSVTSIEKRTFYNCRNLASIEIPNSVTSIGDGAFYGCSSLTSMEIPNSVTSIGDGAFNNCSSLTSIEIPNSVTSIGNSVFFACNKLTIYCEVSEKPSGWNNGWSFSADSVVWGYKK